MIRVRTRNTLYTLKDAGDGAFLIRGNEHYCPEYTLCTLVQEPTPGKVMLFTPLEGPHKGKLVRTTTIMLVAGEIEASIVS